jgi:ABC-type glucose/galactose transport system permease subunit
MMNNATIAIQRTQLTKGPRMGMNPKTQATILAAMENIVKMMPWLM